MYLITFIKKQLCNYTGLYCEPPTNYYVYFITGLLCSICGIMFGPLGKITMALSATSVPLITQLIWHINCSITLAIIISIIIGIVFILGITGLFIFITKINWKNLFINIWTSMQKIFYVLGWIIDACTKVGILTAISFLISCLWGIYGFTIMGIMMLNERYGQTWNRYIRYFFNFLFTQFFIFTTHARDFFVTYTPIICENMYNQANRLYNYLYAKYYHVDNFPNVHNNSNLNFTNVHHILNSQPIIPNLGSFRPIRENNQNNQNNQNNLLGHYTDELGNRRSQRIKTYSDSIQTFNNYQILKTNDQAIILCNFLKTRLPVAVKSWITKILKIEGCYSNSELKKMELYLFGSLIV